jgi:hypothetical protein
MTPPVPEIMDGSLNYEFICINSTIVKVKILWYIKLIYWQFSSHYWPCIDYFNFVLWKIEIQAHKFGASNF